MAKRIISGCRTIVTGASGGLGREIAIQLGQQGADLVVVARREDRLFQLAEEFSELPGRLFYVVGDITKYEVRKQTLALIEKKYHGLDLLINNAGIGAYGRFCDASEERLRHIMEVNFFAAAEMIRTSLPLLKRGQKPMVVNISSILGRRATPHNSEYCASKFALGGLSESLRAEFHRKGIDVLVVCPGTTDTEFFENVIENGKPPWPLQLGISAAEVARETIAGIAAGKKEIIPNRRGRWLLRLNRLMPRFLDRWMNRYG